ncbi:MAG: cytochrome c maturation protein CcmE, partial [Anaerolineae bacterium]|nr:cytochrome c maturation protein CcmE [Anaerolineae bacterium]
MATSTTWEKTLDAPTTKKLNLDKLKFWVGGALIFGAIAYLIIMNTFSGAQYFITVDELLSDSKYIGETVRISGAVIGKTIEYDSQNLMIDFTIAHIDTENENLAYAL